MPMFKKTRTPCPVCGKEPYRSYYKYCSNRCQGEYQYLEFIRKWKEGKISGLRNVGIVSRHVKKYLRRKSGNKCCICDWNRVNPMTKVSPLVADHIDGNWLNNQESNLRLLCPNCDSLNPTYAALNKGNGRKHRAISKRSQLLKSMKQN